MTINVPPIVKLAERLLVDIELAVRGFARYNKYTLGDDLRRKAMQIATYAHRAWRDQAGRRSWVKQLTYAVDEMKLSLQLGCQIHAFKGLGQFEALMRVARDLGKQVGGWCRQQQRPNGQNATTPTPSPQRAETLSTRAASRYEARP